MTASLLGVALLVPGTTLSATPASAGESPVAVSARLPKCYPLTRRGMKFLEHRHSEWGAWFDHGRKKKCRSVQLFLDAVSTTPRLRNTKKLIEYGSYYFQDITNTGHPTSGDSNLYRWVGKDAKEMFWYVAYLPMD